MTTEHHPLCDDNGWDHPDPCVIETEVPEGITRIVTIGRTRYEWERYGCGLRGCPHRVPFQCYELRHGSDERRFNLTCCRDASKITSVEDSAVCTECRNPFDDNPGQSMCKTCADWLVTNIPCVQCGRTDLPLHTNYQCPNCYTPKEVHDGLQPDPETHAE